MADPKSQTAAGAVPTAIDNGTISSYSSSMPRRKPGAILPLESDILETGLALLRSGQATFHGFGLANALKEGGGSSTLTAHGTLYKALSRLESSGLLTSHWDKAEVDGRPRRRLYELTGEGIRTAERALAQRSVRPSPALAPKLS